MPGNDVNVRRARQPHPITGPLTLAHHTSNDNARLYRGKTRWDTIRRQTN
jgi:hypothetical protein